MRRFYFCSADGLTCLRSETFKNDMLVMTNIGKKRADELQGSTKASFVAPGKLVGPGGEVTYTARHGGSAGNAIFVEHEEGESGFEHAYRALAVAVDTEDESGIRVTITFGTTGGGYIITPTAQQIADVVNAAPELAEILTATAGGTGDAVPLDPSYLSGGADDGDWRKFNVQGGNCLRINTVEVI
jgi:hypothetical protein